MARVTAQDLERAREIANTYDSDAEEFTLAMARLMYGVWARGYREGHDDSSEQERYDTDPCPFTHAHTRYWCGHAGCRDS